LPSATLGKAETAKKITPKQALSSVVFWALGKAFAECPFDTRQTKVAVTANLTEDHGLPSVYNQTLGKDIFFKKIIFWFTECFLGH
jgi:hypothetical protein